MNAVTGADLERFPLTAALPADLRDRLADRLRVQRVPRGRRIFAEGEDGDVVYLVLDGKIKVSRTPPDGREVLFAVLGPGDVLGEIAAFDPGPRAASATAVTACEVATLSAADLRAAVTLHPEVGLILLQALARRLRATDVVVADLVFTDVPGRVARALLDLADRFGQPGADGSIRVEHELTQEELAQLVGAARETVNKALSDFASRGWVRLELRVITLLDVERLRQRAR